MSDVEPTIRYTMRAGKPVVEIGGNWTVLNLRGIRQKAARALAAAGTGRAARMVDASGVERLDTAGALEILLLAGGGPDTEVTTREKSHADLFGVVQKNMCEAMPERHVNWLAHWLEEVGQNTVELYHQAVNLCAFFGEILVVFLEACLQPRRFRINAVVRQMYEVWIRALVIVGVLCFLIGVVIAYQGIQQLRQFGAETFAVEAVGISMFRELGVLLTAIIVAGRSGSAFAAQIGTMKVTEEVDALRTIGIGPLDLLVLPKVLALVIALPLLTVYTDIMGIFGGMVMASAQLDVSFTTFVDRLQDAVSLTSFLIGIGKAPVFAVIIALVGCYQGFQVSGSAEDVGQRTTKSVVQSIFLVILVDALFSIAFSWLDL